MSNQDARNSGELKDEQQPFHKEFYRRDLFRVALVYILVGLNLWKGLIILTPVLNLPSQTPRVTGTFLLLLFPFAIVMAWVFEMAPQGLIKIGSEDSKRNPYSRSKRKPLTNRVVILALTLLLAILYIIFPE